MLSDTGMWHRERNACGMEALRFPSSCFPSFAPYDVKNECRHLRCALREVPLKSGCCDYLLLVNRQPLGAVEAKKEGITLSTVADQSAHYAANLPDHPATGTDIKPLECLRFLKMADGK